MYRYREKVKAVKVFISWSGDRSKKIAEVLKKWIKDVIQSVEPFISSQDIPKGARWSADIAKELQDSNFGILCVTKDNFQEPWLLFEAGALSKTIDKTFVVPLLFDLDPSDLSNSPLLQFQATSFSKNEVKKLIDTMNAASEHQLDAYALDEAFEVWYPKLAEALDKASISAEESEISDSTKAEKTTQMLEEILTLSRDNQKLMRNPENHTDETLDKVIEKLEFISNQNDRAERGLRRRRRVHPRMMEELMHFTRKEVGNNYSFLVVLSLFRENFPWIYDLGKGMLNMLKTNKSREKKDEAIHNFKEMLDMAVSFKWRFYDREVDEEEILLLQEATMVLLETIQ